MPIITLTTDLGNREYYTGIIKGSILQICPEAQLIDITHNINPFDIVQAAFIIKNTFRHFPPQTIHLVNVDNANRRASHFIIFQFEDYYFIGPNNGLFTLALESQPLEAFSIPFDPQWRFPVKEIFSNAIAHLVSQKPLSSIGQPVSKIRQRISLQPITGPSSIQGHVSHIDHYGNAILNIHQTLFEKIARHRNFSISFKSRFPLHRICEHYSDVPIGEVLCLVNSAGYLEIAINMGRASDLLSLKLEDSVVIIFEPS